MHDELGMMLDDPALVEMLSFEIEEAMEYERQLCMSELLRRGVTEKPRKYRPGKDGVY